MAIHVFVKGRSMTIYNETIDRDIAVLEKNGKAGKLIDGVYQAPRPDVHGALKCFRDYRKYDPKQIESVCLTVCPHNPAVNPHPDDSSCLNDCPGILFNSRSLEEKKYVEYENK